jgi:hypothetical protein
LFVFRWGGRQIEDFDTGSRRVHSVVQASGKRVFKLPRLDVGTRSIELRASELTMVLDGIDMSTLKRVQRYERTVGANKATYKQLWPEITYHARLTSNM